MKTKFNEDFLKLMHDFDLFQKVDCTEEENAQFREAIKHHKEIPFDVLQYEEYGAKIDRFYRVVPLDVNNEEFQKYCSLKQLKFLRTIKNCVVFFTILTVISLVLILMVSCGLK